MHRESSRGISNVAAGAILVSATLLAGTVAYVTFLHQVDVPGGDAELRVKELDLLTSKVGAVVSATLKNTGGVRLENINVTVTAQENDRAVLTIDNLPSGETGGCFRRGDWKFKTGESYPVLITAQGPDARTVLSRGTKVEAE